MLDAIFSNADIRRRQELVRMAGTDIDSYDVSRLRETIRQIEEVGAKCPVSGVQRLRLRLRCLRHPGNPAACLVRGRSVGRLTLFGLSTVVFCPHP